MRPAQEFGDNPVAVRQTGHYTEEYVPSFVEKWDSLIDWQKREESEGNFFVDLLRKRGVKSVLDVATGTGFHSVRLLAAGFETVSADGSAEMLSKAFANGMKDGHIMRVVQADWRWLNRDVHGEYDAIVCLGNSFTHLFAERDRRKALDLLRFPEESVGRLMTPSCEITAPSSSMCPRGTWRSFSASPTSLLRWQRSGSSSAHMMAMRHPERQPFSRRSRPCLNQSRSRHLS